MQIGLLSLLFLLHLQCFDAVLGRQEASTNFKVFFWPRGCKARGPGFDSWQGTEKSVDEISDVHDEICKYLPDIS